MTETGVSAKRKLVRVARSRVGGGGFALAFGLAIGATAMPHPALAQQMGPFVAPPPPNPVPLSEGGEGSDPLPELAARREFARWVACTMRGSVTKVKSMVAAFPSSDLEEERARIFATGDCLSAGGQIRLRPASLRGVSFEYLYRRSYIARGPTDFTAVPPIDYTTGEGVETARNRLAAAALRSVFDCAVRGDPANARAFVLSIVGDPSETSALRALLPALQRCLANGASFDINVMMAKGMTAEVLYRLSERASGR